MKKVLSYVIILVVAFSPSCANKKQPAVSYKIVMDNPGNRIFHVEMNCTGFNDDTLNLSIPAWMPGYYQLMNYAEKVSDLTASDGISISQKDKDTWQVVSSGKPFTIQYDVKADTRFVAHSFLDSTHAYIVPASAIMYIEGKTELPVSISVLPFKDWRIIATGLEPVPGKEYEFTAPDFDILYDCPLLIGNLEELPSFTVKGVPHRFIGYDMGEFDREALMSSLKKVVEAAVEIFGEVPYKEYTFIGIGPGYGGIEHLNNTTVSFNGGRVKDNSGMTAVLKFLAHEYFHHYNVKRIRPYELGPFDYSRENRTNLLWISEGLTVYYEYLILKRAGLLSDEEFYSSLESNINAYENDPGRQYQSLVQASYNTWSDGPFGSRDPSSDRSISCYDKGAVAGFIIDLAIRNAAHNTKSLDDVMRLLYRKYYRELQRGFTDAEFRQACEEVAGISLEDEFEYVQTTKEIDYGHYLAYAGLEMNISQGKDGNRIFSIVKSLTAPAITQVERW